MNNLERARVALEGLSVGDSFGGFFEFRTPEKRAWHLETRTLLSPPWRFTDDTNMALSIYENLRQYETINQDKLAESFAQHFDRSRGYGLGAFALLSKVQAGEDWREISLKLFAGGSFGNGAAMRIAPLGAYFAEADMQTVTQQAILSAEITHAHPEGLAGAIAVAAATAQAWQTRQMTLSRADFIDCVLPHIPDSVVKQGCTQARDLPVGTSLAEAVQTLGNGSKVIAQDTVPFVLWCAGEYLNSYEEAMWNTATGGGDVDTNCAMVGGIVVMKTGIEGIPETWIANREALPAWAL